MSKGLKYSALLHFFIISLFCFHLPHSHNKATNETVIAVSLISRAELTNLYNRQVKNKTDKDIEKESSKSFKNSSTESTANPKPKAPPSKTDTVAANNEANAVQTKKADTKLPVQKPVPVPSSSVKEQKLDNLPKDLSSSGNESKDSKKNKTQATATASSTKAYDSNLPLSISETDNIKSQIERAFNNPIIQDFQPGEIVIKLRLTMSEDGQVQRVISLSGSQFAAHHAQIFQTFVDSLTRAAHVASPIQGLPPEKYHGAKGWQEIELTFDASSLMN